MIKTQITKNGFLLEIIEPWALNNPVTLRITDSLPAPLGSRERAVWENKEEKIKEITELFRENPRQTFFNFFRFLE